MQSNRPNFTPTPLDRLHSTEFLLVADGRGRRWYYMNRRAAWLCLFVSVLAAFLLGFLVGVLVIL